MTDGPEPTSTPLPIPPTLRRKVLGPRMVEAFKAIVVAVKATLVVDLERK